MKYNATYDVQSHDRSTPRYCNRIIDILTILAAGRRHSEIRLAIAWHLENLSRKDTHYYCWVYVIRRLLRIYLVHETSAPSPNTFLLRRWSHHTEVLVVEGIFYKVSYVRRQTKPFAGCSVERKSRRIEKTTGFIEIGFERSYLSLVKRNVHIWKVLLMYRIIFARPIFIFSDRRTTCVLRMYGVVQLASVAQCHCPLFEPYDVIAYPMTSAYNFSQQHEFNRAWALVRSSAKLTAIVSKECFRV